MANQKTDGLIKLGLKVVEACAYEVTYWGCCTLVAILDWDTGLERKLKELSLRGRFWALDGKNDYKKNGSLLVRKFERSRINESKDYASFEEFQEVSSPVEKVGTGRENQLHEPPVADSKGAESHEKPSSVGSNELEEALDQYATLDKLTEESSKETPKRKRKDKSTTTDVA